MTRPTGSEEWGAAEGGEGVGGGGVDIGLLVRVVSPVVAQPVSNVQHALNANQNVADLLEKRILKNLQWFEAV